MIHRRGIVLTEALLAVALASLILLSAGKLIGNLCRAENRVISRWHALLACQSVLEYSSAVDAGCDTIVISGGEQIHVISVRDPLSRELSGFIATASWSDPTSGSPQSLELGRVVLNPYGQHSSRGVHEFK